jgi:hypothetical protein
VKQRLAVPPLSLGALLVVLIATFRVPSLPDADHVTEHADAGPQTASTTVDTAPAALPEHPDAEAQISARPLFEPGRTQPRPAEPTAAAAAVVEPPVATPLANAPQITMRGAMLVGNRWQALIGNPDGSESWIEVGGTVEGWSVTAIGAGEIELQAGSQVMAVQLYPQ